jgi:V-type H+-transporting ATPase subunit D
MQLYKQKIAAAKKGHELLKRKADALKKKFKDVMKELLESKTKMGKECKEAYFLIAEAKYAAGEFQYLFSYSGEK